MTINTQPDVVVMFDIESFDVGARSIVTEIAFVAIDPRDPERILREMSVNLPIQPQAFLKRTFSVETLMWWMGQSPIMHKRLEECTGNDMQELFSLIRSVIFKFKQVTEGKTYQVWARGPQFDITNIESLMADAGEVPPWKYSLVRDLRTLMDDAGITLDDVPRSDRLIPHIAKYDCQYQLHCYTAAMTKLGRDSASA